MEKQFGSRKVRADRIRLVRDAQLETLARAYDLQKQELDRRHAQEIEKQRLDWKALSIERKRLWDQWQAEFEDADRKRRAGQGSQGGDGRARSPAPPRPKDHFPDMPKMAPDDQFAALDKMVRQSPPKPDDSRVTRDFAPAAAPESPQSKAGWKKRRSAAERKADGSYKPRDRNTPKPRL